MFAGLPSRGHGEYFRDLFQITRCVSLPPRDGSPGGHPLNRHLLLCLGPLTDLCHDFLASADTLHLHSVWVICDLWQTGSGGGWSPCALGSCSWRPLLSRLPCPNSILHSPFLLWRCCPFFSLFWFLSWMMSFFFYLFFFSSFLILSYLLHALHHHPLLPSLSSPPSLPFFSISQHPGTRRELAHQEYTNTGFEYFLWWERRVREPLRSIKSVGPSSNQYCPWLHHSWQELSELSMAALLTQTSKDFSPYLSCSLCWHNPRFGVSHLLSNLGRGQWKGGANREADPSNLTALVS